MEAEPLRSIVDEFVCPPECPVCLGGGHVCEEHPSHAWGDLFGDQPTGLVPRGDGAVIGPDSACYCGAPGMPCGNIALAREALR